MSFSFTKAAIFSATLALVPAAAQAAELPSAGKGTNQSFEAWNTAVREQIENKHFYPRTALQQGIQGRVKVRLTISDAGKVTGVKIVESSGNDILDEEAFSLAMRLKKLPAIPGKSGEHTIVVPLTYRISGDV